MFDFSTQKPAKDPPQELRPQRLLKLAALLEGGGTWTWQELTARFGVVRRTLCRDIQLLRNANVPVVADPLLGGYRIARGAGSPCPKLQIDELVALVLAIKFVGPLPDTISGPCDTALAKVLSAALPEVRTQAIRILDQYAPDDEEAIATQFFERRQSG